MRPETWILWGCTSGFGVYVLCNYTHSRWELPKATQVFLVVFVLRISSINELHCVLVLHERSGSRSVSDFCQVLMLVFDKLQTLRPSWNQIRMQFSFIIFCKCMLCLLLQKRGAVFSIPLWRQTGTIHCYEGAMLEQQLVSLIILRGWTAFTQKILLIVSPKITVP